MGPLDGKRILVTRPAGEGDDLTRAIERHGATAVHVPVIAFAAPDDPQPVRDAIEHLERYSWLLFTSVRGADAFFDLHGDRAPSPKIAAVGPKTAAAVERRGAQATLVPQTFAGDAVARALIEATDAAERILFVRAQEGRDEPIELVRAAGRTIDTVAGYKTVATGSAAAIRNAGRLDAITFASASAATAFAALIAPGDAAIRSAAIACIGESTAQAARARGFAVDAVARESTAEGLVLAIETYFVQRPGAPG